jgi:hypothetical protein
MEPGAAVRADRLVAAALVLASPVAATPELAAAPVALK